MEKEPLDRPPVSIFTQSSTVSLIERLEINYADAHKNPALMAELASAQADIFGFESVRAPFCLTAEAERFGCRVDLGTQKSSPVVRGTPFSLNPYEGEICGEELLNIEPADFISSGRTAAVIEAVGMLSLSHGACFPVIAGTAGPLTVLAQMFGAESVVMSMMVCPGILNDLAERIKPCLGAYLQALADAGADAVVMAEGLASPDVMDPSMFNSLAAPHLDCLTAVKGAYSVLHICGNALPILSRMEASGASALSIESAVDPYDAAEAVSGNAVLIGSIGTVFPLMTGTPEQVRDAAKKCIAAGFDIIAPGCGVPLETPDCNLLAMVSAVKNS